MGFHFVDQTRRLGVAVLALTLLTPLAATSWGAEPEEKDAEAKKPTGGIEEVIVTAERTEANLQDVPIAITALTGQTLQDRQILSTSDVQMNAPNVSYTNTNFGSSSLAIRGVGRLVTAGSGDAGVSTHINDVPFATNLPAMEFYDMERVEILRGPQGTLYGRNATGGVMNMITAKPNFDGFSANLEAEYGNYEDERLKAAVNIPVTDTFALRFAGQGLSRDGYIDNKYKGPGIDDTLDGRAMYSYRISALWNPTDEASAWVIYSKFHEDDNKVRINNQICKQNSLPTAGCLTDQSGQEPINYGSSTGGIFFGLAGAVPLGDPNPPGPVRPKLGLRDMWTDFNPKYYYDEDIIELGTSYDFDHFRVSLIGGLQDTTYRSLQDYNMDVGVYLAPTAANPTGEYPTTSLVGGLQGSPCGRVEGGTMGAIGGCIYSRAPLGQVYSYDRSDSTGNYWTAELKVQSAFDGMWNFLVGYNFSKSRSSGDYFVVSNSLDVVTAQGSPLLGFPPLYPGFFDSTGQNPGYQTRSYATFGELYFTPSESVKITAGLRYNNDYKEVQDRGLLFNAVNVNALVGGALGPDPFWSRVTGFLFGAPYDPSLVALYKATDAFNAAALTAPLSPQRLAASSLIPIVPQVNEARYLTGSPTNDTFHEITGRFGVDWTVNNESSLYAFYSRGYKPGGFNPPINPSFQSTTPFTFDNEQIDAYEVGSKNLLMDSHLQLNVAVFHYNYQGLQIASIQNNTAVNQNIDANMTGAEVEGFFKPEQIPNLAIDLSFSYLHTDIKNVSLLDTASRTQDDPAYVLLKNIDPGSNTGINYIAPVAQVLAVTPAAIAAGAAIGPTPGPNGAAAPDAQYPNGIPAYFSRAFLQANGVDVSDGLLTNLAGNKLPNAPQYKLNVGIAYTFNFDFGSLTPRYGFYWQDSSYAREYNRKGDKIPSWTQQNASINFDAASGVWGARLWIRNIADKDNVTGHYLTSDTSGLFQNYFLTEPRVYGATLQYNLGAAIKR
jgi:iron complex outermembrane recepter protein